MDAEGVEAMLPVTSVCARLVEDAELYIVL